MPRRQIVFRSGQYYHIYNQGAGGQPIFHEEENYRYLLRLLKKIAHECHVSVIAYCLLPNHYHWLLRQDQDTEAGMVPRRVFGSYTQAFNRRYNRRGTLFGGRFQAKLVDNDIYLRHLCRYIHWNPVRHGIVSAPEQWPFSNYLDWIGARRGSLLDRAFVQTYFPDLEAYRRSMQNETELPGSWELPGG